MADKQCISDVVSTGARKLSRCACVVPRANFAAEFLACNPSCGWHPTFSNPSRAAGQALEGAWLEDLQPAPDAQLGKKRGRPGRPSKKDSMSKCDSCRKQKRPCGPGPDPQWIPTLISSRSDHPVPNSDRRPACLSRDGRWWLCRRWQAPRWP